MFVEIGYTSSVLPMFEKTCATTQNNVKSRVFWILKKNNEKT